jgi:hypothetical protein
MTAQGFGAVVLITCHALVAAGCDATAPVKGTPLVVDEFRLVSSGHTGCLPPDNEISNITVDHTGNGTWNATCKGKVYLCASLASGNAAPNYYSCALSVP